MAPASHHHRDEPPAISPGLLLAALIASAAVAVSAFNLTGEVTLGIDLGTTFSVAATCDAGVVRVVTEGLGGGGDDGGGSAEGGGGGGVGGTVPSVVHFLKEASPRRTTAMDLTRGLGTFVWQMVKSRNVGGGGGRGAGDGDAAAAAAVALVGERAARLRDAAPVGLPLPGGCQM
jgi:hypothetical protein